jgi:hypothetical protein
MRAPHRWDGQINGPGIHTPGAIFIYTHPESVNLLKIYDRLVIEKCKHKLSKKIIQCTKLNSRMLLITTWITPRGTYHTTTTTFCYWYMLPWAISMILASNCPLFSSSERNFSSQVPPNSQKKMRLSRCMRQHDGAILYGHVLQNPYDPWPDVIPFLWPVCLLDTLSGRQQRNLLDTLSGRQQRNDFRANTWIQRMVGK